MRASWSASPAAWRSPGDVAAGLAKADCLIDFTRPEGTLHHLELAKAASCGMVIGTTGFSAEGKAAIAAAAEHIPVVFAPNMAIGVQCGVQVARSGRPHPQ